MNKRENGVLISLYWLNTRYKNDHWVIYRTKEVLQCLLRGEIRIAENLAKQANKDLSQDL